MKRLLVLVLCCVCCISGFAQAESGIDLSSFTPEQLEALQKAIDSELNANSTSLDNTKAILEEMIAQGAKIRPDKLIDFTAETDLNGLLGTEGSYTSKTDFGCEGYADGADGPVGGTIEYFPKPEYAKNRFNYLNSIYIQMPTMADSWMYLCGNCVFRVDLSVDEGIAIELAQILENVLGCEISEVYDKNGKQKPGALGVDSSAAESPAVEETSDQAATEGELGAPVTTPAPTPVPAYTALQKGSKGSDVAKLQARLKELGFLSGLADGSFGGQTEAAVRAFQAANGLEQTGIASSEDQAVLFAGGAISANGSAAQAYDPYAICPIELSRVKLHSSYGMNYVSFTAKNVSGMTVSAFTYAVRYYDAYGDQLSDYSNSEHVVSYSSSIGAGKSASISTRDDYSFYMEGAATVSVAVTRVLLEDGTDLNYDDPVWFEGKL